MNDWRDFRDERMGVIPAKGRARVRHMAWTTTRHGVKPICGAPRSFTRRWRMSVDRNVHALPVCRRCITLVENAKAALDFDNGFTN